MNSRFLVSSNKTASKVLFYHKNNQQAWSCLKLRQISNSSTNLQKHLPETEQPQEPAPSTPASSSSGSGLKILTLTLTGFTLGLGYVYFNKESRQKMSAQLPQATILFDSIDKALGRQPEITKINKPVEVPVKFEVTPKPILESKKPEKVVPVKSEVVKPKNEKVEKVPEPIVPKIVVEEVKPVDWKVAMTKFELEEAASIADFESKLYQLETGLKQIVANSISSTQLAIQSLNNYRQSLREALDENRNESSKEAQWTHVTELFERQNQLVNQAKEMISLGAENLNDLEALVKSAKRNASFKDLKSVRETQGEFIEQQRLLKLGESRLQEALIHANVLRAYTNEQKEARSGFLKEMQALQPEGVVRVGGSEELSNEEINGLLIHAHKRVLQLQKQIEKIQTSQNQQIQAALEDQQSQYASLQEQNNTNLRNLCQKEFALEKEQLIEFEKQRTNEAIAKELSSQAAAHNNHLAQMLKMQHDELAAFYDRKLTAEKEQIRADFFTRVASTIGKVTGIENALQNRVNLELQANNASQLWLAVQNLHEILHSSTAETNSELAQIKSNIEAIKVSAPENEFVQKLISSVPKHALDCGVWTEPDLKERFAAVKNVCGKVALIDERGGSLVKYFLSYVQSFFIVNAKLDHAKLDHGAPRLDEVELSTFNILNLAEYYVENGQFDLAIKLMRQLKGEPSRLAKDWLNDATVLLEIKQACQLLTSYISSIYIGTHLK